MSCAADEHGDDKLLSQLQRRLKPSGGGIAPKKEHLAVALLLARNPSLEPRSVWKSHGVSGSGDIRKRIVGWRGKIIDEALLNMCANDLELDQSPVESIKSLIVPQSWWQKHAPGIKTLSYDAPVVSADQTYATRAVHACIIGCDELQHGVVTYDLPAKKHRDVHRRREEACIRSLDSAAADAHRARMSELQREQRLSQHTGDEDAVVRRVLNNLIARLEREASRAQQTWHCPGGCAPGSECARAAFRLQCLPGDDDLRQLLHAQWRQQRKLVEFGEFRGESGHRFVRADEQARCYHQQEQELQHVPGYDASFGDAAAIAEMKHDFLLTWSGNGAPLGHWSEDHRSPGASGGVLVPEYLGAQPTAINPYSSMPPDQFGPDHWPVGPIACARRGCVGCCDCRDQPAPAPYVQTRRRGLIKWVQEWSKWQTIDELRADIECMVSDAESEIERARLQPMPSYLLERTREPSSAGGGAVICIAGAVRRLISADELAEWSSRLNIHSIYLQVRFPARLRGPGPLHS